MGPGVQIGDECVTKYQELKLGHQHAYVFFRMSDDLKEVIVEKTGPPSAAFEDFHQAFPASDCRYAVYDLHYDDHGEARQKIVFVLWAPENAKIKAKMMYTANKDALRRKLVGIGAEMQATDRDEISLEAILAKVKR